MKYIDAELLREKIAEQMESLPREVGRGAGTITSKGYGMMQAFQIMRSIIDSLQQEPISFIPKFKIGDKIISTKNSHLTYDILEVGHVNELGNPEYKVEIVTDEKPDEPRNIKFIECKKMDEWGELIEKKEQKSSVSATQLSVQGKGVYKICPHCKSRMIRDESRVYTSIPPQYGYECPKCGAMEFDIIMYDNPEMGAQNSAEVTNIEDLAKCGDGVTITGDPYSKDSMKPVDLPAGFYVTLDGKKYYTKEMRCNGMNVKVVEPKSAEWSEEDEDNLKRVIRIVEENDSDWNELTNWLKSLPEKFNLQLKTEWDEEDMNIIETLIRELRFNAQFEFAVIKLGLDYIQTLTVLDKCRRLCSQPHWKPSEEQMKALNETLYYVLSEIGNIIAGLYGRLKKLM